MKAPAGLSRRQALAAFGALSASPLGLAGWIGLGGLALPGRAQAAGDPSRVLSRIAVGSCADPGRASPIWGVVQDSAPDLMVYAGDNVYASRQPWSLEQLQAAYARLAADPGFQRLRAGAATFAIWDDHDYGLNDGGAAFSHKQASKEAFLAFWGAAPDDPRRSREGNYHADVWGPPGRRVQLIGLDNRWFLSPWRPTDVRDAPGKERYLPDPDPSKTMLGEAQWAWLEEQLRQPAELRLIVSGLQVVAQGHGFERWGNFPRERQRLFDLIARTRAEGVVLLSGDRHFGALYRETEGVAYPLVEMTSSGITHPWTTVNEPDAKRVGELVRVKHFGTVDIDWERGRVLLALRDEPGRSLAELVLDLARLR